MVEEHGMHRLADIIVSPERERQVAHPAAHMRPGQMSANPLRRTDKIHRITIVFRHAGGNSQHVRVKYYVMGIEAHTFRQQAISAGTDFHFPLVSVCLSAFVKSHHDDRRPEAFHLAGMCQKDLLSLFQGDGIDNAFALHTLQPRRDNVPFGRVNHDRHTGNLRL